MKRYYLEIINDQHNYYEIDNDKRVLFWKQHPTAKEVDKKEYDEMLRLADAERKKQEQLK
jgi:hypothetical protein